MAQTFGFVAVASAILFLALTSVGCGKKDSASKSGDLAAPSAAEKKSGSEAPKPLPETPKKPEAAAEKPAGQTPANAVADDPSARHAASQGPLRMSGETNLGPLEFETVKKSYGLVKDTLPQKLEFPFKNTSKDRTARIKEFITSCGCVGGASDKESYGPGESGVIRVTFNPQGREGKDEKTISVAIDDPAVPPLPLTVSIEIVPVLYLEPKAAYIEERSDLFVTKKPAKRFTLTSRLGGFEVTGATIGDGRITLVDQGKDEVEIGGEKAARWSFDVLCDHALPEGRLQTKLEIKTNDPSRPLVTANITVESTGELKLSQNPVYLRLRTDGVLINRDVVLMSRSQQPFKITSVEVKDAAPFPLTAEIAPPPQGAKVVFQKVILKGKSSKDPGKFKALLVITTDVASSPRIEVPIYGGFPENAPGN